MISRRKLFRRLLQAGGVLVGVGALTAGYGVWEASDVRVSRGIAPVPRLPDAFQGKVLAILTDLHHGPWVGIKYIREVVRKTNELKPDLVMLVGDYAHRGTKTDIELPPCLEALSKLEAPLGIYAVPGNHDMQDRGRIYQKLISSTPLVDVTNRHFRLTHQGEDLWIAGVDDLWWGQPNIQQALRGIPTGEPIILLSHNPDYAEEEPDPRVGLMLSGHMHGGQVHLPWVGSPWAPSKYGAKYRHGLVQGPATKVFISRGLGETAMPLRLGAPPEINLLTLQRSEG